MTPNRLSAALPPPARAIFLEAEGRLDPAEAYLASADDLSLDQARSRARNARRGFGRSWPDSYQFCSIDDPEVQRLVDHSLTGSDPLALLLAAEAAADALAAPDAAERLAAADVADLDTAAAALAWGVTRRRAQQLRSQRLAAARAGQLDLLDVGDEC